MARTVVVTGGSAGIGLATACLFAERGWQVAIVARDPDRLEQARAMIATRGGPVIAIRGDVADPDLVEAAAAGAEAELGPIDAWVNNAMSTVVAPADEITPAEYQRVTATTYLSQVYGTLAALKRMKPRDRGTIVQVSSGLGIRAAALQAAYCASKFAVNGFTDSLRTELVHDKVDVSLSVVYLPAVNTPQPGWARRHVRRAQKLPDPLFDPRLCAEAIVHAAEHPQREIWVGRSTLMMAVAQSVSPSFADRQAASFYDDQLADPAEPQRGNLEEPVPGPARIDGDSTDRAITGRREFFTSRQRDLLKAGAALGVAGLGAAAGFGLGRRR